MPTSVTPTGERSWVGGDAGLSCLETPANDGVATVSRRPAAAVQPRRRRDRFMARCHDCTAAAARPVRLGVVGGGGDTATAAGPVGVEELAARLVDALVGVGTEEVALRLQEIGGKAIGPVAVE